MLADDETAGAQTGDQSGADPTASRLGGGMPGRGYGILPDALLLEVTDYGSSNDDAHVSNPVSRN